jgi:hypothetical protein
MPYIILNNTAINREKEVINRFILASCIVDSPVSSETPKHITSIEDLDLYFEKDFTNRDYFVELIERNVGLLLYKPVTPEIISPDIYYDYENYEIDGLDGGYIEESDLPLIGQERVLYVSRSEFTGPWIWVDGLYYEVKNLPQNIETKTRSINIRDSLRIMKYGTLENFGYNYCYPKYSDKYNIDINLPEKIDTSDYFSGRSSFSFTLKFKKNIKFDSGNKKGYYIGFSVGDETYLIWFSNGKQYDPMGSDYVERGNKFEIRYIDPETGEERSTKEIIEEIIEKFIEQGYQVFERREDDKYYTYELIINKLSPSINLFDIPGFRIDINNSISNQILSDHTKNKSRIEFFSKTIGNAKEKVKIKISQVKRKSGFYTIEISKYDYIEVFTGSIYPNLSSRNVNEEMLDSVINRESKIVSCTLNRYREDGSLYKEDDSDSPLYLGEWTLNGGEDEEYTYLYYQESLDRMKKVLDFKEDFLLVPNINNFKNYFPIGYQYYPEYEFLLDYAKTKNCQVLIDNLDTEYKIKEVTELPKINISFELDEDFIFKPETIYKHVYYNKYNEKLTYGHFIYDLHKKEYIDVSTDREYCNKYMNNFIYNYIEDDDNYLIYFYKKIKLSSGSERPGFYVFLENIITGLFETRKTKILYEPPVQERFLIDSQEEVELIQLLEKMKSNYLSYNNHYYYYDQLFNGDTNKNFSIITRYILGKIKRTLEAKKWGVINKQTITEKIEEIGWILRTITLRYSSIIKKIELVDVTVNYEKRLMSLSIQVSYTELINKDIYLNITINT